MKNNEIKRVFLCVLDSVGGGLMSALGGMGVAFYTSLVGVACAIVLTLLRSIFSPAAEREKLEARMELWLDHNVAPSLPTDAAKDDVDLMNHLIKTMEATAKNMDLTLQAATNELRTAIDSSRAPIAAFNKTVEGFNSGVRDFSEFNYNLRGTVERMDVSVRDLVQGLRQVSRSIERREGE
jgi:methyl-accepting chemotaxis protein